MPNTNAPFTPRMRSDEVKIQIGKLEAMDHRAPVHPTLESFDTETEALLARLYARVTGISKPTSTPQSPKQKRW